MKKVNFVNIIPNEVLTIIADKLYQISNKDVNNLFLISKETSNIAYDLDLMIKCLGHKNALLNISGMKKGNVNMINYILSKTTETFTDLNELIVISAKSNNLDILNYWINYGIKIEDNNVCEIIHLHINKSMDLFVLESLDPSTDIYNKIEEKYKYDYISFDIVNSIINNYDLKNYETSFEGHLFTVDNITSKYNEEIVIKFFNKYLDMMFDLLCLFADNNYRKIPIYLGLFEFSGYYDKSFRHDLINHFCQSQSFILDIENFINNVNNDNDDEDYYHCFHDPDNDHEKIYEEDLPLLINYGLANLTIFKISCKYNFDNYIKYSLSNNIDFTNITVRDMYIYNIAYLPTDILLSLLEKNLKLEILLKSTVISKNKDILIYLLKNNYNININNLLFGAILNSFYRKTLQDFDDNPVDKGYLYYKRINKSSHQMNLNYIVFILNSGANINYNNNKIIRHVFYRGNNRDFMNIIKIDTFKTLLNYGADIKFDDYYPLRYGTRYYRKDIIKLLIDLGSDIHANNNEPLKNAILFNNQEAVEILIDYGVIIDYDIYKILYYNIMNIEQLSDFKKNELSNIVNYILSRRSFPNDLQIKLIHDGIDINAFDGTALRLAVDNNFTPIVKLLLLGGANYNNYSLLKKAIENNNIDIVMMLVSSSIPEDNIIQGIQYAKNINKETILEYLINAKALNDLYK